MAIAGRGAALIGYVVAGTAKVGQRTPELVIGKAAARRLEVAAVERLSSMQAGPAAIGLVFRPSPSMQDLQVALPAGTTLQLSEPDTEQSRME